MASLLTYLAALVLVAHGGVHLLGTAVYLELAEVAEFTYKTTLLGGFVDVGDTGMRVFGVLWAVAAVGFVVSASALVTDWDHWQLLLSTVVVFSLILTALDYTVAYAGVVVNVVIIAVVSLSSRM
ncbi:ABC transporter permease [Halosolutus halophilus]|uniref:ABC transporter permease n=1 Tax=Halosolutus halophilus TaxID=1552990 RepID=UPI002234EF24|nr:ABC transporter permease [Halosolutus halophilus]